MDEHGAQLAWSIKPILCLTHHWKENVHGTALNQCVFIFCTRITSFFFLARVEVTLAENPILSNTLYCSWKCGNLCAKFKLLNSDPIYFTRKSLNKGVLLYIHLNLAIALLTALVIFVAGIETATPVPVSWMIRSFWSSDSFMYCHFQLWLGPT